MPHEHFLFSKCTLPPSTRNLQLKSHSFCTSKTTVQHKVHPSFAYDVALLNALNRNIFHSFVYKLKTIHI